MEEMQFALDLVLAEKLSLEEAQNKQGYYVYIKFLFVSLYVTH